MLSLTLFAGIGEGYAVSLGPLVCLAFWIALLLCTIIFLCTTAIIYLRRAG